MKRSLRDQLDSLTTANCLIFLSQVGNTTLFNHTHSDATARVFECKTCSRQFPSFQALGGHRASHKKPRLAAVEGLPETPARPKSHECSICGLEFAIGQALGGHMRRHRALNNDHQNSLVKKTHNTRVSWLDLNLTPFENDSELFRIGKTTPMVDCFL